MAIGSSQADRSGVAALIGVSSSVARGREFTRRIASHERAVLLTGPAGTGKELIARIAHSLSARASSPFMRFDGQLANLPFAHSQLAGHAAGAIPGVRGGSMGCVRAAEGGTLLVRNIEGLSLELQRLLMLVLEEGQVVPLGGDKARAVNVRILATSRIDLREQVNAGRFLARLYELLSGESHRTLPLARRPGDVAVLAEAFLDDLAHGHGLPRAHLTSAALQALLTHCWPGNVRQLRQVLEESAIHCDHRQITTAHLEAAFDKATSLGGMSFSMPQPWGESFAEVSPSIRGNSEELETRPVFRRVDDQLPLDDWPTLADAEREHIEQTLCRARYDLPQAALMLGIEENELRSRLVQHAIELPEQHD